MRDESDDMSLDAGAEFPDIGADVTPTNEMIVEGRVGNGTWDRLTPELAERIQIERREMGRELKVSRREAYEEGVKDALGRIADLEHGIINIGLSLMQRLDAGEPLNKRELDTLKLAQDQAKEMKDRGLGKSTTKHEVTQHTSILALIRGDFPNATD